MKLLVINNLSSGYGEGTIYDFIRSWIQDGDEVIIRSTDGTSDLQDFLYDVQDFDLVVASGGDGTVSSCAYALSETNIPILAFPAGTANLLAMNLTLPNEPHALAKIARDGLTMDFDIGEIETESGHKLGFSIMAGAGYDALIMRDAAAAKRMLGFLAYVQAGINNFNPPVAKFKLTIDGVEEEAEGIGILIMNFSRIQFDLTIVHKNLPRDGEFDIVVMKTKDAIGLLPVLFASFLDRNGSFPDRTDALAIYRGKEIRVEADSTLQIQYDGEVSTFTTPFTARVIERGARFIVNDECLDLYAETDEAEG